MSVAMTACSTAGDIDSFGSETEGIHGSAVTVSHAAPLMPGEPGQTKVPIYDNTDNGWNVTTNDPVTGGPDPEIGFTNFRPTVPGDPEHIIVVVNLQDGAPNCTYTVELVTDGNSPDGGLPPDGNHTGFINVIGELTTNGNGHGNSGALMVDVTTLSDVAAAGQRTYAHVDVEDYNGTCVEADGTSVATNEYGSPGVSWIQ